MTAADDYNAKQLTSGAFTIEHITELVRFWQAQHPPLETDGMAGSETLASIIGALRPAPFLRIPLPTLPDGRKPSVTSSFRPPDRPNHNGCDWFYEWRAGDKPDFVSDKGAAGKKADGTPKWVVPYGVSAVAAAPGRVTFAGNTPTGHQVTVEHSNGWRTLYIHLLDTHVTVGANVAAGTSLGLVGDNPADNDGRHLHFELSPTDHYAPVDPEPYLIR